MTSTRINDSTRSHPRLRASQCGWRRRGEYWEEGGGEGGAGTMIRKDRGGSMPMGTKKWTRKRKKRRRRNLRPPYLFPFFCPRRCHAIPDMSYSLRSSSSSSSSSSAAAAAAAAAASVKKLCPQKMHWARERVRGGGLPRHFTLS